MSGEQHEVFGGVPAWLLVEYLTELGGRLSEDGALRGDGWRARVAARREPAGGLSIGRVTVTIEGPDAGPVMARLRTKAQRGGG